MFSSLFSNSREVGVRYFTYNCISAHCVFPSSLVIMLSRLGLRLTFGFSCTVWGISLIRNTYQFTL